VAFQIDYKTVDDSEGDSEEFQIAESVDTVEAAQELIAEFFAGRENYSASFSADVQDKIADAIKRLDQTPDSDPNYLAFRFDNGANGSIDFLTVTDID